LLSHSSRSDVNMAVSCAKISVMDQASALLWAARQGQLEAVRLLIKAAADVNAVAASGWTPLYAAALNGHYMIVEELLANGAHVASALALGDERTNINLRRMVSEVFENAASLKPQAPPTMPPLQPLPAVAASAPPPALDGLSNLGELEALRLRLEWSAPPSIDEQRAADLARQTVYKYRYDRIRELETATRSRGGLPASVDAVRGRPTEASAAPLEAFRVSSGVDGTVSTDKSILERLEVVERALAQLAFTSGGQTSGYATGFAEGYEAGFAAGRAV